MFVVTIINAFIEAAQLAGEDAVCNAMSKVKKELTCSKKYNKLHMPKKFAG